MRKPLVIQLVSLVIAAAVAVLGSSFDASAAKKCITIAGKTVCIDDGQDKKSNNNNNPGNDGGSGNNDNPEGANDTGNNGAGTNDTSKSATDKPLDCSKAQCDAGYVKLASRTNTAPAVSPLKASARLTGQTARHRTAAHKARPFVRAPAGLPNVGREPSVCLLTAIECALPIRSR
ncbi:MAG: hypothetical protein ACRECI_03170 [Methyloceanibacter sp.]